MHHLEGVVTGPRPGRMRDRRGRGRRGPLHLPGPLSPDGLAIDTTRRAEFDRIVGSVLGALRRHLEAEPDRIEVIVEDVPMIPPEWEDPVPLSSLTREPTISRIAVYRMPVAAAAADQDDLIELIWRVVLDRLAEVWRISPDDIDPR